MARKNPAPLVDIPTNKLLSINEVADIIGLSVSTIQRAYVNTGMLKTIRLGGTIRFSPTQLITLINNASR